MLLRRGVERRDLHRPRRGKVVDDPRQVETVIDVMMIMIAGEVTVTVIVTVIVTVTVNASDIVIDHAPAVPLDATETMIVIDTDTTHHLQEMQIGTVHAIANVSVNVTMPAIGVDLALRMESPEGHQAKKTKRGDIQIGILGIEKATYEIKSARSEVAEDEDIPANQELLHTYQSIVYLFFALSNVMYLTSLTCKWWATWFVYLALSVLSTTFVGVMTRTMAPHPDNASLSKAPSNVCEMHSNSCSSF